MFEDLDLGEINWNVAGFSLLIGFVVIYCVWFVKIGEATFPFFQKIMISALIIPVAYFILNWQANRG